MHLTWADTSGIAKALCANYPDEDRLALNGQSLQRLVLSLPEFRQTDALPDQNQLKSILWTWMRLADSGADGHIEAGGA